MYRHIILVRELIRSQLFSSMKRASFITSLFNLQMHMEFGNLLLMNNNQFLFRPVLIGTNSVEESEALMEQLKRNWTGPDKQVIWDGEDRFKQG